MRKHYALVSALILGVVLRLWHLTSISLWHDEAFSALLIKYSWGEMFYRIGLDVHPPAYYVALRLWHYVFGNSLFALRGMSVFFGVLAIAAAYAFVQEAFKNKKMAVLVAFFVALSPFQIQYVTEARMYTMGAFFALLAAYCLVKALHLERGVFSDERLNMPNLPGDIQAHHASLIYYIGFVLATIVMAYTHYYLLFIVVALCVYGFIHHLRHYGFRFRRYGLLLLSYILIAVAYLPWLKIFMFQLRQVGGGYWIPPIDRWSIPATLWQMLLGLAADVNKPSTQALLVAVTAFSIFAIYKFLRKIDQFEKWLIFLLFLAPFGGSLAFYFLAKLKGSDSSVYLVRYFLFSTAFYSIILAGWLSGLTHKHLVKMLLGMYIAVNLFAVYHYWDDLDIAKKPGMAGAARHLQMTVEPHHKIYVGSSFEFFNFKYYNHTPVRPLLYSGGQTEVSSMPHFAGTAILTNQDLLPDFRRDVKNSDTVWLLWTNGFGSSKPEVPNNWTQVDEKAYAEVRPYVGTYVYVTMYKVN